MLNCPVTIGDGEDDDEEGANKRRKHRVVRKSKFDSNETGEVCMHEYIPLVCTDTVSLFEGHHSCTELILVLEEQPLGFSTSAFRCCSGVLQSCCFLNAGLSSTLSSLTLITDRLI